MFDRSADTAWLQERGDPNEPLLVYFMWEGEENDAMWIHQMKKSWSSIYDLALKEGSISNNTPVYCDTTLNVIATPENDLPGPSGRTVCAEDEIRP